MTKEKRTDREKGTPIAPDGVKKWIGLARAARKPDPKDAAGGEQRITGPPKTKP